MGTTSDEEGSWLAFEFELLRHDPGEWVVLTGDRTLVALLAFLGLAAGLLGVMAVGVVPLRQETPVLFVLFALVAANFSLIAIVTSLSQFVLGRRLESPGEVRRKMAETIEYREAVGESIDRSVTPVQPDAFLLALFRHAATELDALAAVSAEGEAPAVHEALATLVDDLDAHCEYVVDVLRRPSGGTKHALFVSLRADYETAVHRAWQLQWEHADELAPAAGEPLERLATTLKQIEVASRLFKTVFIESEVSELSRRLLYVGLPAQLAAVTLMLVYSAPGAGPPLPLPLLRALVPVTVAAGFAPFLLLCAYVLRLTVVARRTVDTFPFSSQLSGSVEASE